MLVKDYWVMLYMIGIVVIIILMVVEVVIFFFDIGYVICMCVLKCLKEI